MNRPFGLAAAGRSKASPQTLCQKCLKRDKWIINLTMYFSEAAYGIIATNAKPLLKKDLTSLDLPGLSS